MSWLCVSVNHHDITQSGETLPEGDDVTDVSPPPVLSMILMVIIRYISAILVWILTSLVVLGSLGELTSCLPL